MTIMGRIGNLVLGLALGLVVSFTVETKVRESEHRVLTIWPALGEVELNSFASCEDLGGEGAVANLCLQRVDPVGSGEAKANDKKQYERLVQVLCASPHWWDAQACVDVKSQKGD